MSSIIANSCPSPAPLTSRGVLSSSVRPIDCASRRAGSMVSTTVRRPACAPIRAMAAAVVVLPTPPLPQVTTTRVFGSRTSAAMASSAPVAPEEARGEVLEFTQLDGRVQVRQLDAREVQLVQAVGVLGLHE